MNRNGKLIELERPPVIETAVVARLILPEESEAEVEESLAELERLAWTAGAEVVCRVCQQRDRPHPATLIGAGKVEEVKAVCEEMEAEVVIFDSDLSPRQGSRLQETLGLKVIDRTQLILDIFAQRAQTNEGKHQVELAQLEYALPRLRGRGAAMMRQAGGIGVRGPGEQKLEVDRRRIRERISHLRSELEDIQKHRRTQRNKRQSTGTPTIALVGYTNAGKSSLLNALTEAGTFVEDKLFATLDTRSRRCELPSGRTAVFTDTVGFIRHLPHSLVAAFRATLEEVNQAELLLLVADAAHPAVEEHMTATWGVLEEIGAADKPVLRVYNKKDIAAPEVLARLLSLPAESLAVSAATGAGLDALLSRCDAALSKRQERVRLRIPQRDAAVAARVHEEAHVIDTEYAGNDIMLLAEVSESLRSQLAEYVE